MKRLVSLRAAGVKRKWLAPGAAWQCELACYLGALASCGWYCASNAWRHDTARKASERRAMKSCWRNESMLRKRRADEGIGQ